MEYYIFASNKCNLNCRYCSVMLKIEEFGIPAIPQYSFKELNAFICKTQKSLSDRVADIVLFGGEPTLNYSFIEDLIASQSSLGDCGFEFHYMLHTNGLLLQEIPNTILEKLDSIMLSINYEKVPHVNLSSSYFQTIVDSVHAVKQRRNIPIVARLTITEETSLYSEIALFNPFFDAVYWQIENKYAFSNFSKFYSTYKFELKLVFDMWLGYLKQGILIKLIPFVAAANFSIQRQSPTGFCCGYNQSMVYIQTDGRCYTCAEDMTTSRNLIGQIDREIQFEHFGLENTICHDCPYLHICMGRCGRMHREFSASHIQEYCKLNQVLFELIENHCNEISDCCRMYNLQVTLDDPIYHYTEYTP